MTRHYPDTPAKASQVARAAIPLASKLGLPVNPLVYAVCYEYAAKSNLDLCKAFDELVRVRPKPDAFLVELLYHEHIDDGDAVAVEALGDALDAMAASAQGALQSAEDRTHAFGEKLNTAVDTLEHFEHSPDSLRCFVKNLMEDTEEMEKSTQSLREELASARAEAKSLRSEYSRIKEESLTDVLTGLKNRRAFDEAFATMLRRCSAAELPLSLLVVDIDHFKKVNDVHGHATGDLVLKCLGKILKSLVRGNDVPARLGGEEFAVLLPETPTGGAHKVAEKIRQVVAAQQLRNGETELGQITVSIGLAELATNESKESLFKRADEALYQAKHSGRNQVCVTKEARELL